MQSKCIKVNGAKYKLADAAKKMYIMRGVSGSGKSTQAKQLVGSGKIFSTDDFFTEGEEYKFDPTKIVEAHKWNQRRVWDAARKGIDPIVVDNTTTQAWEAKPYVVIAFSEGYDVDIVEPSSPWWSKFGPNMSEEELTELAEVLVEKTLHGVPIEGIVNMLKRWEFDLDPVKILRSERPVWKPKKAAMEATSVPNTVTVTVHGTFPDNSASYLEIACDSYATYKNLPAALRMEEYNDTFGKASWNSDKNTAVYRTDKPVATIATNNTKTSSTKKESQTMAKKTNTPPKMIRVGGVLYKLAALDVAVQSEMQILNSSIKKLSNETDLDDGARKAIKNDALEALGELTGIVKSM